MDQQQPYTTIGSEEQQTDRPWRRSAGFAIAALLYLTTVALTSRHGGQKVVEQATAAASREQSTTEKWPFSCTKIVRSEKCDPKWPKKRCVTCCRAKAYMGKCGMNSYSPLCGKCCKILLGSKYCKKNPQKSACLACCNKKVLDYKCRLPWAKESCGRCCTSLLESDHCKEDGSGDSEWNSACSRCQ